MKNKTLVKLGAFFFTLLAVGALGVTAMAWFATANTDVAPAFNGSFVQYYFDQESGDGYTAETPLMITKPIHLYNLSRLYKKGIFSKARNYTTTDGSGNSSSYTNTVPHYYFQLGKKNVTDGKYYFYAETSDNETAQTNLSSTSLDMTSYTTANGLTVTPIGQNFGADTDYSFKDHFVGNDLTISNLYVDATDSAFAHAGFFGDVKDGADITSFNFDGLTIDCTDSTTGTDMVAGLVAGYLTETASKNIN